MQKLLLSTMTLAVATLLGGVLAPAASAQEAAKLPPPPVAPVFDDGFVVINLNNEVQGQSGNKPSKVEYSPAMRMRFFGVEQGDAFKVRWMKGKKVLVERRCVLTVKNGEGWVGLSNRCWRRDAAIKVHGDLKVEVRFVDDSEETETLVRTLHVPVARYWRVDRTVKGKTIHSPRYQVNGSDLMGLAYAWEEEPDNITPYGNLYFYFWSTLANDNTNFSDPSWRCKRDGKSVREMNVDGHRAIESIADIKQQDIQVNGKVRSNTWYGWRLMWIKPSLIWGTERNARAPSTVSSSRYNVSKNPGSYVCKLRNEGESVREFSFVVQPDGKFAPHGAQGKDGLSLRPGAHFVDMLVIPSKAEHSFDAKAAKKSVAFGRKWPKADDVKAHIKRFPKTFGKAVPKKPRGAK